VIRRFDDLVGMFFGMNMFAGGSIRRVNAGVERIKLRLTRAVQIP